MELNRVLSNHLDNTDIFRRYVTTVHSDHSIIIPEGQAGYQNIMVATTLGLHDCIVILDRLGFLFGSYYIEENVNFIMRMLIRHGIFVFTDLVLQRLTIRARLQRLQNPHQLEHVGFPGLAQHSRYLWGIFFDAFERNFRAYERQFR